MSALAAESPIRCYTYSRISRDSEGKELGVTRQREDLEAFVESIGGVIAGHYEDNDKSASKFATKPRPEFEAMVKAAAAGGCDVIAAYTAGRITRRPAEFERLIELAERHGVRFAYIKSPTFDLSTADGRMVARVLAAADAAEPDRTSERAKRARQQRRDSGIVDPPASRCYGWAAGSYLTPEPAEARIVKDVFQMVAAGSGAADAGQYLLTHGATGTSGSVQWQARKVHNLLRRPAYAGLMVNSAGDLIPAANVKAIVTPDIWHSAQATLDDKRMDSRAPTRKRLLSGKVQCEICGSRMLPTVETRNRKRGYIKPEAWACKKVIGKSACGGVSRMMAVVDAMVDAFVVARIESAAAVTVLALPSADDRAVADELTALNARLASIRGLMVTGVVEPVDGAVMLADLRDKIGALEGAQSRSRALTARRRAVADIDAAAVWADTSEEARPARRAILDQYVSAIVIGKPVAGPGVSRSQAAANSVTIVPA